MNHTERHGNIHVQKVKSFLFSQIHHRRKTAKSPDRELGVGLKDALNDSVAKFFASLH